MTRKRLQAYALVAAFVGALALVVQSADAHPVKRPDAYPFTGDLERRLAWQEAQHAHAHKHIAQAKRVLARFTTGPTFKSARTALRHWKRFHDVVWSELLETRAALAAAVAPSTSSSGGSYGGSCSYGPSTNAYVNPCGCESSTAQVISPNGTYWGKYQFDYQTWVAHGGDPATYGSASVAEQDAIAARLTYDGWPNC